MFCSVQAGCRQLSELSFFSLLQWRVHTTQRQCQQAGLSLSSLSQRDEYVPWMARRAQNLLWVGSLLLIGFVTCALPSLRPPHADLLETFVMAALLPVGDMWYYPFGHWFDPSKEREYRAALWLLRG